MNASRGLLVVACMASLYGGVINGTAAAPLNIVAIGASNTAGWGVGSQNAYPAQLEALLRAEGYDAHVINAGVSFSTTNGMLGRLDSVVPAGTSLVILQPGGNDVRFFGSKEQRAANIAAIESRMRDRNIGVIVLDNEIVPPEYYQWDGIHFTAKGHAWAASWLMLEMTAVLKRRDSAAGPPATPSLDVKH
jgi:acyl-CoA thioesterase I